MKVLVTGHRGYIGSVLTPLLVREGHDVTGLDTGYFDDCTLVPDVLKVPEIRRDLRDVTAADVAGFDAIVHLGALSNDPIGNLNTAWTEEINTRATIRLAELAKAAGVRRFLFSSSCIMYGMSEAAVVDETAPLAPRTDYARSKVDAEHALAEMSDDAFAVTRLRNGTVYGLSPRMRFDTVMNDFMGSAVTRGKIVVLGDGAPWRPVVHVLDLSRAFAMVLEAPLELVAGEAFNNGHASLNFTIRDLAEAAVEAVPGATLEILGEAGADQRTYQADFSKFARTFPDFEWEWTPARGAIELRDAFLRYGVTEADYTDAKYTRLRWLSRLMETGELDEDLRWTEAVVPA
ncbi:MAG TPA: SDR family oxidoreductase [Solirubrobacteraceae bacterium]|nr:SDR family oxidoreductase [Solirubrobacteraceae bacterium]